MPRPHGKYILTRQQVVFRMTDIVQGRLFYVTIKRTENNWRMEAGRNGTDYYSWPVLPLISEWDSLFCFVLFFSVCCMSQNSLASSAPCQASVWERVCSGILGHLCCIPLHIQTAPSLVCFRVKTMEKLRFCWPQAHLYVIVCCVYACWDVFVVLWSLWTEQNWTVKQTHLNCILVLAYTHRHTCTFCGCLK